VVGVDDVKRATVDCIVVIGNVHPTVEGARRVVVHPHTLTVVAGAVVGAGPRGPSDAIRRRPHADALTATAGRQVASEPQTQARVVYDDRIPKVGAVAGAQRLAGVPCGPVIGRVREAGVATARSATVVVVNDPGIIGAAPFHALRLGHFRKRAIGEYDV